MKSVDIITMKLIRQFLDCLWTSCYYRVSIFYNITLLSSSISNLYHKSVGAHTHYDYYYQIHGTIL